MAEYKRNIVATIIGSFFAIYFILGALGSTVILMGGNITVDDSQKKYLKAILANKLPASIGTIGLFIAAGLMVWILAKRDFLDESKVKVCSATFKQVD